MGKASSAKKVARAARAGGSRRPGQRRALGFPLLVAGIIRSGTLLVVFARSNREAGAAPVSQASEPENFDHWHAAYGVYDCTEFIFNSEGTFFVDAEGDPLGIHTHGDGVIHIHPFTDAAGGRNARMRLFFQDIHIDASDSTWTFPDGTEWDEATKRCGDEPGQIVVAKWNDAQAAADGERPNELITEDFGDIRFRNDREYYTFAFVPESALDEIPVRPEVIADLNNLSDVPPDQNIDAPTSSTTATTAPGATTTTAPGDTTTTTAPTTATTTGG
jgi:hypothetical protein